MGKQVFQTDSKSRWSRFQWTMRVLTTLIVLLIIVCFTMFLVEGSPKMPFRHDYRSAVSAERPLMKQNDAANIYSSFRRSIDEHQMYSNYIKVAEGKHRFVGIGDTLTTK